MIIQPTKELLHLFERMKKDDETLGPWDDLPIFSKLTIDDTEGIFSWDDNFTIEGTCSQDLEIVPRNMHAL